MYPAHYKLALDEVGTKEIPGSRDNPKIVEWFADVGHSWVDDDETAWCAAFAGAMLEHAGTPSTGKLNARSYLQWGNKVKSLSDAMPGDVVVLWRVARNAWQGHVGFYHSHEGNYVTLVSGNKANRVGIDKFAHSRVLGIRRAPAKNGPLGAPLEKPVTIGNKITAEMLRTIAPRGRNDLIEALPPLLNKYLPKYDVNTPQRVALFLANVMAETGGLKIMEENLSYTAERMMVVWPSRFPTLESAQPYARNPRKLANKVYNRFGNRAIADGGWKYRGRGFMQTTFVDNYRLAEKATGLDLVANPDLLLDPEPALIAALVFWQSKGCNELADQNRQTDCRKRINGGTHGLTRMKNYFRVALPIMNGVQIKKDVVTTTKTIGTGVGGAIVLSQYGVDWALILLGAVVIAGIGFLIWKRRKKLRNVLSISQGLSDIHPQYDVNHFDDDNLDRTGYDQPHTTH